MREEQAPVPGSHGQMAGEELPTLYPSCAALWDVAWACPCMDPSMGHLAQAALPSTTLT